MRLPKATDFRIDLRTANQLAAGQRVIQYLRDHDEDHPALAAVRSEHFDEEDGTPEMTDEEIGQLVDAIYNGSVLDIPEEADDAEV